MNHHSQEVLNYVWGLGLDLTKHRWFKFRHKDWLNDWLIDTLELIFISLKLKLYDKLLIINQVGEIPSGLFPI